VKDREGKKKGRRDTMLHEHGVSPTSISLRLLCLGFTYKGVHRAPKLIVQKIESFSIDLEIILHVVI